jgi:hypothetical protein
MAVTSGLPAPGNRREQLRREVGDLLEQIAALVRGRAFLRRAGIEPRELRAIDDEIGRLHRRLARAARLSAVAESEEARVAGL